LAVIRIKINDSLPSNCVMMLRIIKEILGNTHGIKTDVTATKLSLHPKAPTTTLFITNVPYLDQENTDLGRSNKQLQAEMKLNPLFKRLDYIVDPYWVPASKEKPLIEVPQIASVRCIIREDKEKSYSTDLTSRPLFLFGHRVFAHVAKPKATNPSDPSNDATTKEVCTKCFKIVKPKEDHTMCTPNCKYCGVPQHSSDVHAVYCRHCILAGNRDPDRCLHQRCLNCAGSHVANVITCPKCAIKPQKPGLGRRAGQF
jgi:hypothetical protein